MPGGVTRALLAVLAILLLASCGREPLWSQEAYVFGTRVELLVWGKPEAEARAAMAEVLREFDRLHRAYHAWQPSQLTALNDAIAAGRPHEVSDELAGFIREAQRVAAQGEHLFDPGIGRLVELWGFHGDSFAARRPAPERLAALKRAHPSVADLRLEGECPPPGRPKADTVNEPEPRSGEHPSPPPGRGAGGGGLGPPPGRPKADTVNEPEPRSGEPPSPPSAGRGAGERCRVVSGNHEVALDFGGYLKGVALDRAAAILKARGMDDALINIGGNVMALGAKGGKPWRVGIQHPRPETSGGVPLATLELRDGEAVGTSGDYQRFFELDGRRYCHLLDPRTAEPAQDTRAVTVLVGPRPQAGMWSDAASKPLFIAGGDWRRLTVPLGIDRALRIDAAGRIEATPAMQARLHVERAPPAAAAGERIR